jgi:simple sugar transport system permease protein
VLNVGLEGMMLAGAFAAFAAAWAWSSPALGAAAGIAAGLALALVFAFLVLRARLDPIVTGVGLNLLSLGTTGVLFRALPSDRSLFAPVLPDLTIGPGAPAPLASQNALGWAALALTGVVAAFLSRTLPGLVLRAAGENPEAVDTAGWPVTRVRFLAVLFGGACAGAAGAYLSIGWSNTFVEGMTAGRGFVALAIVVFARWNPWGALAGALLFGLATSLQVRLQGRPVLGVEIPYQFFQALPYALTLAVLARPARGASAAPAALARPFRRGR